MQCEIFQRIIAIFTKKSYEVKSFYGDSLKIFSSILMPRKDTLILRDLNEFSSGYVSVINNRGAQSRHTFVNYYFSCENASVKN